MECLTLKKNDCKNCHKCIRHCPVKSIRFSGNQARIMSDDCILCGQCFVVCPQDAKQIVDETEKVKVLLQTGAPVVVSLAPSFIANYDGVGINSMRAAIKKLGFYDAEETAIGATMVKREYERILEKDGRDIIITSCCHSINLLIQKYFPQQLSCLANVLSPMQAHCRDIKARIPGAKTVFVGPCVAKKDEAQRYDGIVDAVLTFDELTKWMKAENIEPEKETDSDENSRARFFPVVGGILKTMAEEIGGYTYMALDGAENCIAALHDIESGKIHRCFIEMSACTGGCISGPVMEKYHRSPVKDYAAVAKFSGKKDFDVPQPSQFEMSKIFEPIEHAHSIPNDEQIANILRQMGKVCPDDELNCGSCGYNTCREKAIAVYQGKAEISMCLPYLRDKAESFAYNIINNMPSGIIILNDKMEVQHINQEAQKILNIRRAEDVLGGGVVRLMETDDFIDVLENRHNIYNKQLYLSEYGRHVIKTVIYDNLYHTLICIMRDITAEENAHAQKEKMNRQTVEIADKVVDKQMRIVQEIAMLLGETAAETKIALTKLKEVISDE